MKKGKKLLLAAAGGAAALYAGLFAVFYFDLDGNAALSRGGALPLPHYDKMERRDITKMPYDWNKYGKYEYKTE